MEDAPSPSIGISDFFRRQTESSKFSYFDGTDSELIGMTVQSFPLRKPGKQDGAWIIPIQDVDAMEEAKFYSALVRANPMMFFNAQAVPRTPEEPPLISVSAISPKQPGSHAEVILYSKKLLGKEASTKCDFEIVCLKVSDVADQPDHYYDMARSVLEGDEDTTAEDMAKSIMYWSERVYVRNKFTRYIDHKIVEAIRKNNMKEAVALRRNDCPEEPEKASVEYVDAVYEFLQTTDNWFH